jgi:hypothetical protein
MESSYVLVPLFIMVFSIFRNEATHNTFNRVVRYLGATTFFFFLNKLNMHYPKTTKRC